MKILGIETSCDECSVAVVEDGRRILSHIVASQIEYHRPYSGVVPEIASRKHIEWILGVYSRCIDQAGITPDSLDGIAVTSRPGLVGSLVVGLSFAKGLSCRLGLPFVGLDHILSHLYAPHLQFDLAYPFLGVLVSGGHTIICRMDDFETIRVLGTTIDDACGEAFDKVAKHLDLGYPGGVEIDRLARDGDPEAFAFPTPSLHKGDHRYDLSYSGLKTAVINQLERFRRKDKPDSPDQEIRNICASFEHAAIRILTSRVIRAAEDEGLHTIVAGGGVAANTLFRSAFSERRDLRVVFPSLELCTDNAAMVAALGWEYLSRGRHSLSSEDASARVSGFRRGYP
jgi:N6-L-threonylcarbamoyladenine synthase